VVRRPKRLDEQLRLIFAPRPRDLTIDLLEADQVRVLLLDDLDHALEPITAVAPADALVNIITK
jgi:hypothetical protein